MGVNKTAIVQHYRSEKANAIPAATDIEYGEIAVTYAKDDESLFIKNTNNEVVKMPMKPDYSGFITTETFEPVSTAAFNAIGKGTLGTINGISLEESSVTLDLSLYIIVSALPTEDIKDNKIYLMKNPSSTSAKTIFDEYIYLTEHSEWDKIGQVASDIDLSGYLTKTEADKLYMVKSTNPNVHTTVDKNGALGILANNGQAYLAVRQKIDTFIINIPYAAASFGVKSDGTAAFSHKQYQTYNTDGTYTGARNTAVLQFAGPVGLRYGVNKSTASDLVESDYKYVGVIDSPDEFQRVYSAKQVDDLLKDYTDKIDKLKQAIIDLGGTVDF